MSFIINIVVIGLCVLGDAQGVSQNFAQLLQNPQFLEVLEQIYLNCSERNFGSTVQNFPNNPFLNNGATQEQLLHPLDTTTIPTNTPMITSSPSTTTPEAFTSQTNLQAGTLYLSTEFNGKKYLIPIKITTQASQQWREVKENLEPQGFYNGKLEKVKVSFIGDEQKRQLMVVEDPKNSTFEGVELQVNYDNSKVH